MNQADHANLPDAPPVVLLIDDSIDVHRLFNARLRQENVQLVLAQSGREGLEIARTKNPSLILLDLTMPVMDGFEVLRCLKEDPATMHTPVIVVSATQSSQDKVTAFELGAVDYITKPFDMTELRVRVRSALRMHSLLNMLAQRAQIDGLSGLWNRAYFDSRMAEEVSGACRTGNPLALAMLDVDHFKSVNDTYGHPAGDAVLQALSAMLRTEARQTDVACRYGGEEFALIMRDTTAADAQHLCDRIRMKLESMVWPRHPERTITCSIGVSGIHGTAVIAPQALVEAADQNLYAAKRGGRNRVVVSEVPARPTLRREAS